MPRVSRIRQVPQLSDFKRGQIIGYEAGLLIGEISRKTGRSLRNILQCELARTQEGRWYRTRGIGCSRRTTQHQDHRLRFRTFRRDSADPGPSQYEVYFCFFFLIAPSGYYLSQMNIGVTVCSGVGREFIEIKNRIRWSFVTSVASACECMIVGRGREGNIVIHNLIENFISTKGVALWCGVLLHMVACHH